jgi:SAM-dependent MidA family methyltransferase
VANPPLKSELIAQIKSKNKITFADFMEMVLYHPSHGYYSTLNDRLGDRSDYITSPALHPIFGRLLATQIAEVAKLLHSRERFWIVEVGAGHGMLCKDILSTMRNQYPAIYDNLSYGIVERSHSCVKRQREITLKEEGEAGKVLWLSSLEDEPLKDGINGCIVTNEFFDALPVHRVKKEKELTEIYVCYGDDFEESVGSLSTLELKSYFEDVGIELREGMEAEVNLLAIEWMKKMALILRRGIVITIDYGYPAQELYSVKHARGTLICYYKHRIEHNPYVRLGLQDITSHVDFTSLARAGEKFGLSVTGFTKQGNFLFGLGVVEAMQALRDMSPEDHMAIKGLFMPGGFGDTFKVLIQHKGLKNPSLKGLSFKNSMDRLF